MALSVRAVCAFLALLGTMIALVTVASAHPGAPYRSVGDAQRWLRPETSGAVRCRGLGARRGSLYKHFTCAYLAGGDRWTEMLHTTLGSPGWTFSMLRLLGDSPPVRMARRSISGDYATLVVSGSVRKPAFVEALVFVSPDQRVDVNWTMVCSKAFGAASKSGSFATYDAMDASLKMPFKRPDECTVSAAASLLGSGRLTLQLLAWN